VVAIITPTGGIKNLWDLQVRICRAVGAISCGGRMQADFLDTTAKWRAQSSLPKPFPKKELLICVDGQSAGRLPN
jgi:hypothetical protein